MIKKIFGICLFALLSLVLSVGAEEAVEKQELVEAQVQVEIEAQVETAEALVVGADTASSSTLCGCACEVFNGFDSLVLVETSGSCSALRGQSCSGFTGQGTLGYCEEVLF